MKSPPFVLWAAAALILAGCGSKPAAQRTALDCPPSQGVLKRASVTDGGRSCLYTDADGDEVALQLIPVAGSPAATLVPIEQKLQALIPPAPPVADNATKDEDDDGDRADITLPGVRIQASGDRADVKVGTLHVDASDGGAVIREARDTRLRGEQLSFQRRGYRATFIVARDDLPGGLASVGYEAGGPRTGPLTVAILKMKGHQEVVHRDVRRLVRLNGGI